MQQCWVVNADKRPTFKDARSYLLNHPSSCLQSRSTIKPFHDERQAFGFDVCGPPISQLSSQVEYNGLSCDDHSSGIRQCLPLEPHQLHSHDSRCSESQSESGGMASLSLSASLEPSHDLLGLMQELLHASDAALLSEAEMNECVQSRSITANVARSQSSDLLEDEHIL